MVNTTDLASQSIPELRPRKGMLKWLLAIGVVVLAGGITLAFVLGRDDDPAIAACAHLDELAQQQPERWDRFVDALVRTVEHRVYNSLDRKFVNIDGDTRNERCRQSFAVIRETMTYSKYTTIARCVAKVTTYREGSACFESF